MLRGLAQPTLVVLGNIVLLLGGSLYLFKRPDMAGE
jgi:hypothetical protein